MSKQYAMIVWCVCGLLFLGIVVAQESSDSVPNEVEFCGEGEGNYPEAVCFDDGCTRAIKNHIKHEFNAAFKYLYMGALFGQYIVERPGMTNFFLESATEERGHAIQMLDYLVMRGIRYNKNYTFTNDMLWEPYSKNITEYKLKTLSIVSALEEALKMEIDVTKKINNVITSCANDFHAADVFTNPILEEQHVGMRKLQGAIQTMKELEKSNSDGRGFAEYIFDQKMLKGEL